MLNILIYFCRFYPFSGEKNRFPVVHCHFWPFPPLFITLATDFGRFIYLLRPAMTHKEGYQSLKEKLHKIYEESEAANISELVIEHITGLPKTKRASEEGRELTAEQEQLLQTATDRLLVHEPVQYVLHKCWFYGLALYVDDAVLVPRPETEELVQWLVNDVKEEKPAVFQRGATEADDTNTLKIIDIGTGSGCIALALKKAMPVAEVWGCDASDKALNVARRNGADLNIRVDFQSIDFLDEAQQKSLPTVHIVVSNPPYIPAKEGEGLAANVLLHEPHTALFVPDAEPLLFYSALARFGGFRLYAGGAIYAEIHENQGAAVVQLFKDAGYKNVELRKDMQGKDRMIRAVI